MKSPESFEAMIQADRRVEKRIFRAEMVLLLLITSACILYFRNIAPLW